MTTDEQRIFVAEWMGWTHVINDDGSNSLRGFDPNGNIGFRTCIPPLTLDWLHVCEKKLSNLDHQKFCLFLHKQVMGTLDNFDVNGTCNLECISRAVNASSEQRLAALVETIKGGVL